MIIRAPGRLDVLPSNMPLFFLAGSIEMGKAVEWQAQLEEALDLQAVVLNPRRLDWDSSWKQDISDRQFKKQVVWELEALELATYILMYFDPATKSPISLLELGLHARSSKLVVCCPEGFWRKGNVDIVCQRYNVWQVQTLDALVKRAQALARGELK